MKPAEIRHGNLFGALKAGLVSAIVLASGLVTAQAETLKFGNEGVYPPFSMVDSAGNLTGVEPDLAREMCKRMGVECEIIAMDFKALIPSLLQGKFDGITTQLSPTPERKEKLLFGVPMVYNPMTFVAKKGTNYTYTAEGLAKEHLKVALQKGSSAIPYVEKHFPEGLEHVYYDNPDQMKLDLLAGRIDIVFDSKINWTYELIMKPEGKDYMITGGDHWSGDPDIPLEKRGYSWVVPKGSEALLAKMDKALLEIMADCTYTKIRKKYLDAATLPADEACVAKGM